MSITSPQDDAFLLPVGPNEQALPGADDPLGSRIWSGLLPASGGTRIVVRSIRGLATYTLRLETPAQASPSTCQHRARPCAVVATAPQTPPNAHPSRHAVGRLGRWPSCVRLSYLRIEQMKTSMTRLGWVFGPAAAIVGAIFWAVNAFVLSSHHAIDRVSSLLSAGALALAVACVLVPGPRFALAMQEAQAGVLPLLQRHGRWWQMALWALAFVGGVILGATMPERIFAPWSR